MAAEPAPILTVYSCSYCHLCDEMIEALRGLQGLFHFEIAVVDVDADPELERRHGESVPVLMHGGRSAATGSSLRSLLRIFRNSDKIHSFTSLEGH